LDISIYLNIFEQIYLLTKKTLKIMKKQFITLIVFSVLFFSCQKDNTVELTQEENYQSEFATVVEDIDENNTLPEASEFYQNITEMADWYAVNPEIRKSINVTKKKEIKHLKKLFLLKNHLSNQLPIHI